MISGIVSYGGSISGCSSLDGFHSLALLDLVGGGGWLIGVSSEVFSRGKGEGVHQNGLLNHRCPFSLNWSRLSTCSGFVEGPWLNWWSHRSWHLSKPWWLLQRCSIMTEANSCMISIWTVLVEEIGARPTCSAVMNNSVIARGVEESCMWYSTESSRT